MLKELSKYENLGTPSYHFELLRTLRDNKEGKWLVKDVSHFFHNRIIDERGIFDGCLPLLSSIGIVIINSSEEVSVDEAFFKYLESEGQMVDRLVERLLLSVNSDPLFHDIFCSEYISYDIIYRSIQIDNSAFSLRYSCFKQLLIDLNVLQEHPTNKFNKYIINGRYRKIFDKTILPEIKKRKIGIEELRRTLEQNLIYGEEAERFVLKFENTRLKGKKEIDWVAEYSTNDGYDVASYDTEDSIEFDRFIEVKSYAYTPYFYWSRNEIDMSRIKGKNYFLYLVDRNQMNNLGYSPIIIQNPFINILSKENWAKVVEKYRINFIG